MSAFEIEYCDWSEQIERRTVDAQIAVAGPAVDFCSVQIHFEADGIAQMLTDGDPIQPVLVLQRAVVVDRDAADLRRHVPVADLVVGVHDDRRGQCAKHR